MIVAVALFSALLLLAGLIGWQEGAKPPPEPPPLWTIAPPPPAGPSR